MAATRRRYGSGSGDTIMVILTDQDLLELLRYTPSERHTLEILGYDYSTRGARQFRRERPDFLPQICRLIRACLEEAGSFPREPSTAVLAEGTYLERRPDGVTVLHASVEVSMNRTAQVRIDFESVDGAILELLRRLADPAYLTVPRV
jgi:hypothetical protein